MMPGWALQMALREEMRGSKAPWGCWAHSHRGLLAESLTSPRPVILWGTWHAMLKPAGEPSYVFHHKWYLHTLHVCSEGWIQCLRECLCPCLDLIRVLARPVAEHITGAKAFWWALERVTAEAVWSKERRRSPRTVALDGTELPPRKHVFIIHSNP